MTDTRPGLPGKGTAPGGRWADLWIQSQGRDQPWRSGLIGGHPPHPETPPIGHLSDGGLLVTGGEGGSPVANPVC